MSEVNWRGVRGIWEVFAHDHDEIEIGLLADLVSEKLPGLGEAISTATVGSCTPPREDASVRLSRC